MSVHRVATAVSQDEVRDEAWKVMLEKFILIVKTDSFKEMSENELLKYIREEGVNVANEDPIFEALVTWVRHDLENRKYLFETLVGNITLSHCSYSFLGEVVRKEPLMKNMVCLEHLADAFASYNSLSLVQLGTAKRGFSGYSLIAIYEDRYWTMKPGESDWVSKRFHVMRKFKFSHACMTEDGILITGGDEFSLGLRKQAAVQCWKLSVPGLKEIKVPDLIVACYSHASVCVGNKVYVLGGQVGSEYHMQLWLSSHLGHKHDKNDGKELKSVECLEDKAAGWKTLGDKELPLYDQSAVKYNDLIYAFGGSRMVTVKKYQHSYLGSRQVGVDRLSETPVRTTLQLDTQSGIWSKKADMPQNCTRGSSVVYRDRIYVLGGNTNCCMSYNPHQDQWKSHSQPATIHDGGSAVVWKNRILLCGGTNTSVIEEYNPNTDTWSECKYKLPETGGYPAVFVVHL